MKHVFVLIICMIACTIQAATYEAPFVDTGSRSKYVEVSVDGIKRRFAIDTGCSSLSINMRLLDELDKQKKVKLYWHIYHQLGNETKAKEFERYNQ